MIRRRFAVASYGIVFSTITLVAVAYAWYLGFDFPQRTRVFPIYAGGLTFVLVFAQWAVDVRWFVAAEGAKRYESLDLGVESEVRDDPRVNQRVVISLGAVVAMIGLSIAVGLSVAAPIFMLVYMIAVSDVRPWIAVAITVVVWFVMFYVLEGMLGLRMPPGLYLQWHPFR